MGRTLKFATPAGFERTFFPLMIWGLLLTPAPHLVAQTPVPDLQSQTILPLDRSDRDPALARYLDRLREAVEAKDAAALRTLISPDIKNGFGGDDGAEAFDAAWHPEGPDSQVWPVLTKILGLGGDWTGPQQYCAPYLFVHFPDDFDPFEHQVVVGTGVRLRAAPGFDSRVLGQLSWTIVKHEHSEERWRLVTAPWGVTGWVAAEYLYSPVGYRACFQSDSEDQWRMVFLVEGD